MNQNYILLGLLLVCGILLFQQVNYIYSFSTPNTSNLDVIRYDTNGDKILTASAVNINTGEQKYLIDNNLISTPISRNDIQNLAIRIINVNILLLCIAFIINDFLLLIKTQGGLRKCLKQS